MLYVGGYAENNFCSAHVVTLSIRTPYICQRTQGPKSLQSLLYYQPYLLYYPTNARSDHRSPKIEFQLKLGGLPQFIPSKLSPYPIYATRLALLPAMFTPTSHSSISIMARAHLRKSVPTHTRIASIRQQPRPAISLVVPSEKRHFSRVTWLALPRKDSQDRESIDRESTEYSKSGTDDEAAGLNEAAFDPNTTDPGAEKNIAGKVST